MRFADLAESLLATTSPRPGFRISLLHLIWTLTLVQSPLEAFYPRVVKGGVVMIDEYADPPLGESEAVDEYVRMCNIVLRAVPFSRNPTAYFVK